MSSAWERVDGTRNGPEFKLWLQDRLVTEEEFNGFSFDQINQFRTSFDQQQQQLSPPVPASKRLKTSANQNSSSGMAASKKNPPKGIGTLPYTGVSIFPNVASKFWDGKPLDPSDEETSNMIEILRSLRISGPMNLCKMSETKDQPNIQEEFLDGIARRRPFNSCMSTERLCRDGLPGKGHSNAVLQISAGVASEGSMMDGYLHSKAKVKSVPCVTSVFEVKNDCTSPKEGNLEAVGSATNIAIGLVHRAIATENVVVPIFSTNGRLGQVLAVSFLPGSTFPVVNFVTTVFDLFNDEGLLLAASGLCKMVALNSQVESQCNDRPKSPQIEMEIDLDRYHLKSVNTFFEVIDGDYRDKSLVRFFEMTSILRSHSFACCPLAYRLGDKKSGYPDDAIVFENLHRLGYCIGLPRESTEERQKLVGAMKEAVAQFHSLGLVHMDLYLSNVMWCKDLNGVYSVKIVDFDSIHQTGERFSSRMVQRLEELGFPEEYINGGAQPRFDESYFHHVESHIDEPDLLYQDDQEATKRALDDFFNRTFDAREVQK